MNKRTIQLAVFFLWLWSLLFTNSYIIERRASYRRRWRRWTYQPDRFIMPSSVCSSGSSAQSSQCSNMRASRVGKCRCRCHANQENFFYASNVGKWKCLTNEIAHSYGGCEKVLDGRATSEPLIVIPMATPTTWYYLPSGCSRQLPDTEYDYLECDGTWKKMDTSVIYTDYDDDDNQDLEYLTYSAVQSGTTPTISGRIVRLNLSCWDNQANSESKECVLFKIKGKTTCSVMMSSTSSPLSVTTTATSSLFSTTSSEVTSTVTEGIVSSSVLSPSPALVPSLHSKQLSTSASTAPLTTASVPTVLSSLLLSTRLLNEQVSTSTSTAPLTTAVYMNPRSKSTTVKSASGMETPKTFVTSPSLVNGNPSSRTGDDSSSSGLIEGVVSGLIGLTIVIAVTALIIRKRRQKRKTNSNNSALAVNAGYGRGVDNSLRFSDGDQKSPDEEEYSYAYNNTAPFAKTSKQDAENNTSNTQGLDCNNSVTNLIYGEAEGLNNPCSLPPEQEIPVYSVLEEPNYAKVDKSRKKHSADPDGPIYNTLEQPEYAKLNKNKKPKLSENRNEPLYNVLERPFENGTEELNDESSCYHVLEEPNYAKVDKSRKGHSADPDGPIYNTLEQPEYAKLNKNKKPKLSENRNEPLYNVLERPFENGTEELNDESSYHVLEGPYSEDAPVYHVLEGLESDGTTVYGSLEGQDPHIYGALDIRDTRETSGYDDMVYDAVGDVINDQRDIYQQLNHNGQRNSDVYQALNHPDKTMYLKELNQSISDA